jgi:hypothetical protein
VFFGGGVEWWEWGGVGDEKNFLLKKKKECF